MALSNLSRGIMKKQTFIYLSSLGVSAILWSIFGYSLKRKNKKSGTLNVFYEDDGRPSLSLRLDSEEEIKEILKNKVAVFDVRLIRVERSNSENKKDEKIN